MSLHLIALSRFDSELRNELHRRLLKRSYLLATLLGDVLSGKDRISSLAAIGLDPRPGMHPEEQLRDALNQAERRRRLLDAGDERYGRCDICGVDLPLGALERMAWADRCEAHDARWLGLAEEPTKPGSFVVPTVFDECAIDEDCMLKPERVTCCGECEPTSPFEPVRREARAICKSGTCTVVANQQCVVRRTTRSAP